MQPATVTAEAIAIAIIMVVGIVTAMVMTVLITMGIIRMVNSEIVTAIVAVAVTIPKRRHATMMSFGWWNHTGQCEQNHWPNRENALHLFHGVTPIMQQSRAAQGLYRFI
jgi:high-affinity Fe2+/Pb2+ permease